MLKNYFAQIPLLALDFSKLLHGFVKIDTWNCQNQYMDFSKLLNTFGKVVLCIFRPLPKKQAEV